MSIPRVSCVLLCALLSHMAGPAFSVQLGKQDLAIARSVGEQGVAAVSLGAVPLLEAVRAASTRSTLAKPSVVSNLVRLPARLDRAVAIPHRSHHPARRFQRIRQPGSGRGDRPH